MRCSDLFLVLLLTEGINEVNASSHGSFLLCKRWAEVVCTTFQSHETVHNVRKLVILILSVLDGVANLCIALVDLSLCIVADAAEYKTCKLN